MAPSHPNHSRFERFNDSLGGGIGSKERRDVSKGRPDGWKGRGDVWKRRHFAFKIGYVAFDPGKRASLGRCVASKCEPRVSAFETDASCERSDMPEGRPIASDVAGISSRDRHVAPFDGHDVP